MLGVNAVIPPDIAVLSVEQTVASFHARFSATSKIYRYTILNDRARYPLYRRTTLHVPLPLNIEEMRRAAQYFVGTHDFTAFAKDPERRASCERTILSASICHERPLVQLRFHGNGFLYNMVRILTGTLIEVGMGRRDADSIPAVLAGSSRIEAGSTAPAVGLTLERVFYGDEPPTVGEGSPTLSGMA
jgi:tRNA pseudouridine38-40 synthase